MDSRRLFIWFIVAAFVLNGVAARAFIEIPAALAPLAGTHHASLASTDQAAFSAYGQKGGDSIAAGDQDKDHQHADSCLKCCQMCSFAVATPEVPAAAARFFFWGISFAIFNDNPPDPLAALDPAIPKSVV
jgi:hypothetical protein